MCYFGAINKLVVFTLNKTSFTVLVMRVVMTSLKGNQNPFTTR